MALAIALLDLPDSARVRVLNPPAGGSRWTSAKRARRFVRSGRAHVDGAGQLVFEGTSRSKGRVGLLVSAFSGCDAFPGRAVLPPSPSMRSVTGTALRPPMRMGSTVSTSKES
jgi:hypothetical protein